MPTGIGTTSQSTATPTESQLIQGSLGLTRSDNDLKGSKAILESLRDDKTQKIKQRETTNDLLILTDVTIDGYDDLIINMDKPLPGLLQEINTRITTVKNAYDQRIAAGCLSDLKWIKTAEWTARVPFSGSSGGKYGGGSALVTYQRWEVKKDPDQYRTINYYGAKYYKRPHNRDYGANLVKEIPSANVGIGSTFMIINEANRDIALSGIQTGDTISDDLENPTIFQVGNLPEVVGFGSEPITGFSTTFGADISVGSTILAHTGAGIVTVGISTGDRIIRVGVTSSDTFVVGFGTTNANIQITDGEGDTYTLVQQVDTLILSKPAIASTTLSDFGVGITTYYPTIFISTTTAYQAVNENFVVIRSGTALDEEFDYTKNGSDPVEIGLIKDQTKVGYGHTLQIINNGDPDVIKQWREVADPEPPVGAGFASYYEGALSWPGQNIPVRTGFGFTGPIIGYTFEYRPEGYSVVIGLGLTTPQPILATTSSKPPGSADTTTCNTYTANIAAAEADLNAKLAENTPKLNYYANASDILRDVRDEKEILAWSLKRGTGFMTAEINKLTQQIATLESVDFTEFE